MRVPHYLAAADAMFNKLFKPDDSPEKSKTAKPAPIPAPLPDKTPWQAQLQAALGNDEALLAVAKSAPFVDIKHAAVQALSSEDALSRPSANFATMIGAFIARPSNGGRRRLLNAKRAPPPPS